ncbi:uncharacterized protein LOC117323550 [Pecten maximus]|uniref:uncharacterized protein LOC117323550 n=1 Tax=Pecten maximus TaxID=6579 RepID=UPI00145814EC|nr:uncharacterized protein LOC117323550 [Pecten maximus]
MNLTLNDTLSIWTPGGTYEIQLLFGDITKLPKEDSVNLIMVSAFPGDYSPLRGTVIGALKSELGMSVRDLSRAMELDLRRQFHCWLSRPLEGHLPYKRLLCFERTRGDCTIVEDIRQMFRVFVPVLNNKESTVITPLLATGHQNKSPEHVLSIMVHCAAQWIMAGLPLKCFKIVIYGSPDKDMIDIFSKIKTKYTKLSKKRMEKSMNQQIFDIFIMFQDKDKAWCRKIEKTLKEKKADIKICADVQKFDEDEVWQDQIFQKMSSCMKIIVLLTPMFVSSPECLEQFNMAMCCNRLRKGNILQPFYILTVESMPVYITLVQYQDCRIRKETDNEESKIQHACSILVEKISNPEQDAEDDKTNVLDLPGPTRTKNYDVFISYSHKNPDQAGDVLKELLGSKPEPKIFFDRSELTMGSMWQKTLYDSVDGAQCVIAMVSQAYVSSLVCQEEYNIALLRHLIDPSKILFIPVCIEDLSSVSDPGFCKVDMVDGKGDNFPGVIDVVTKMAVNWLQTRNSGHFNRLEKELKNVKYKEVLESIRTRNVAKDYKLDLKQFTIYRKVPLPKIEARPEDQDKQECDVAIGFAGDATYCAMVMNHVLDEVHPGLKIKFLWERNKSLLQDLDTAHVIVLFLSEEFVNSEEHMENLHIALCRQRALKGRRVVHFVQTMDLPSEHSFLKLLPIAANFKDKIWYDFVKQKGADTAHKLRKYVISRIPDISGTFSCAYADYLAMVKVGDDVMDELLRTDKDDESYQAQPMLLNLLKVKSELVRDKDTNTDINLVQVSELASEMKKGEYSTKDTKQQVSEVNEINSATTTQTVTKPTDEETGKETEDQGVHARPEAKKDEQSEPNTTKTSGDSESPPNASILPVKPETQTEQAKPETQTEQAKPEPQTEQAKPETQTEQAKPETQTEQAKPETQNEPKKPETQTEQAKPETQNEPKKPETQTEQTKPETQTEQAKPETQSEQKKRKTEMTGNNTKTSKSCQIL